MTANLQTNALEVAQKLQLALERIPGRLFDVMVTVFRRDGARWESAMTESISGPLVLGATKSPSAPLATRRGAAGLKGSFFSSVLGVTLNELELRKFSTSPYARTHELGESIYPKKGRFLAIPLELAMTPSGVPRQPGPRSYPDLFFYESTNGKFFLARQRTVASGKNKGKVKGKGNELDLMFLLVTSVYIPPRLGMRAMHQRHEPERLADIRAMLAAALKGVA